MCMMPFTPPVLLALTLTVAVWPTIAVVGATWMESVTVTRVMRPSITGVIGDMTVT